MLVTQYSNVNSTLVAPYFIATPKKNRNDRKVTSHENSSTWFLFIFVFLLYMIRASYW